MFVSCKSFFIIIPEWLYIVMSREECSLFEFGGAFDQKIYMTSQYLVNWTWQNIKFDYFSVNPAMAGGIGPRRRKTHGYAIFSSEMRKKIADNTPMTEASKIIAAEWRSASAGVNFINVKRARFLYECHFGSFFLLTYTCRKKLPKWRSYEKRARLTLMKLTPGRL